ncbi:hypothetical protein Tco_0175462 [Tanacetum coccineum]
MGMAVRGVVAGDGEWHVAESGVVDRIDRLMGSIFGLGRKSPPEKFSGGGGGRRRWLAENEREREREKRVFISFKVGLHYLLAKVVPVGMYRDLSLRTSGPLQDPTTATITTITITNDEGMQRVRTLRETISHV